MLLNQQSTRVFHRTLFGGMLETIELLKRGDDQKQGTVVSYIAHQCRRSLIVKTGEPIQGDMLSNHRATWHIPKIELERLGIATINPADRLVDSKKRYWQPEANMTTVVKLFENQFAIDCVRIDPPGV